MTENAEPVAEATEATSDATAEAESTQTTLLTPEEPQTLLGGDVDDSEDEDDTSENNPPETTDTAINYDGLEVPETLTDFAEKAKELKVSKDKLASLLDVLSSNEAARAESAKAEAVAQEKAEIEQMLEEFRKEPNHAEVARDAARFVKQYGGDEMRQWFEAHPKVGNDPHLVKLLGIAGSRLSEGKIRKGESANADAGPAHRRMYPNTNF